MAGEKLTIYLALIRASLFLKLSLLTIPLGAIVQGVGFTTEYWTKQDLGAFGTLHGGLWTGGIKNAPGWLKATQAFEVLGFIAAVVALILIILYIFVPATSGKRIVFILSILACFAAAGCILLGIIIYGSEVKHNLSWSFALCCIAGIIFAISGLLLVVDMCKR
ncbi:uncharacterized protein LOC127848086 isoform X3 [Dreissena polymorpha]|uniref:Uncharacterized protein n=1 Tax=Dreissena polymorpha TaxID=45954 RepID=A0A9D4DN88_DREPO|nr:uncharacterized protein LOC127848086 isoform X3 [Dreissena polymorpha]XP_052236340.1 uncharacterized protein LOC127848086 isoform X3 [Dreissena polymorpha]XP_052236341.1 uncharacterized protein LOC127848086 isoform X3 [Dreissena polymorpha]XP_052236342.1 uncharacterized protein LOC127848086 isoform X3 [Dreissena polymorpha]KAH3752762.1 hypothetical protein DPMN_187388 [Dreissena polymorpha]